MKRLIGLIFFLNGWLLYSQPAKSDRLNFDHFSSNEQAISREYFSLVQKKFFTHPEFGKMPFNGPPGKDCIELIDRRDEYSRYYVKKNSHGSDFILQKSMVPLNYKDENGWWREIDYRLEKVSEKIFVASNQPNPVRIDLKTNTIALKNSGLEMEMKIPQLIWREPDGVEHFLGKANIEDFTSGDDGIKIKNVYEGIDLVYVVRQGFIESSFILNKKLPYQSGELIMRQAVVLPDELSISAEKKEESEHQDIYIISGNRIPYFKIEKGFAFDNSRSPITQRLFSKVVGKNAIDFSLSSDWLNNTNTVYPVTLDPIVMAQNALPVASIAGTRFSPVCWTNSCDYFLQVITPPNATIIGIFRSFEFYATGLCFGDDGAYSIDFLSCHAPTDPVNFPGGVYNYPAVHLHNTFISADTVLMPEFNSCLPVPQCAPDTLDFVLHFFRCNNDPDTTCNGNCIRATKPWIMYVEGRTAEISSVTGTQQVCEGSVAQMAVVPQYGVAPYAYSWMPGGTINNTLTVTPVVSSVYTVTVTDACGITSSATSAINLIPNNNPGFTITPNPVCVNTPVSLLGNGVGPANDYDWTVPGSSAPGNIINDTQNPNITYTLPGNFDVILTYPNGSCSFNDTMQLSVNPLSVVSVGLLAQPSVAICPGDTVTFHATPVNGGVAPVYDWIVDGVNVQSGTTDSLVTGSLVNGSLVQLIMHSNLSCISSPVDTASLFIAVNNALVPQVTISPDTSVCVGSLITLNAVPVNGGSSPVYQWYANGNPVAGANSSSYSFNVTPPDTIISVQVQSSLGCVTTPTTNDTSIVNILQNIQPVVTINANPAGVVCSGDSIHFTASPVNGGGSPLYQWFVNGNPTAILGPLFDFLPANNDSVSVQMTSSLTCVSAPSDDDYIIANVSAAVSPAVTLGASPSAIICQGNNVTFTASALNAGGSPVYSWTVNGIPSGINDSIFSTASLNNNDVVRVIVNSSLSCAPVASDTDSIVVSVSGNAAPNVSIQTVGNVLCENDTVQFVATGGNGGPLPSFQWLINGVATAINNDTISLSTLTNGDTVSVTMTSSLGCVSPSSVTSAPVIVSLKPKVDPQISISVLPSDSVCIGQQVFLQATLLNGGSQPSFQWYVNSIPSSVTTTTFASSSFAPGDIIVANMTSNADCLLKSGDTSNFVRIVYHQPLNLQVSSSPPDCPGMPATVTAVVSGGNGGPYHIIWSNGSMDTDSIVINAGRNTQVLIQAEDNCTAQPATATYTVPVLTGPVADFAYVNPSPGSFLNTMQFINLSKDFDTWTWYFSDSTSTNTEMNPLHQFPLQGTYDVKLVTVNNDGCVDSITYHVSVQEEVAVFYPNTFSPNGDGRNDFFQPIGASLQDYEMTIWNRWGEMIYEGNSKMAWDGKVRGSAKPAPEGVYVFRIDLKEDYFDKKVVTGKVTLIR